MSFPRACPPRLRGAWPMLAVLAACASPATEPADTFVGTYTAVTINGVPIPGRVTNNQGVALEVREGSFVFRSDGTCSSRTVFVAPDGTERVREVDATWTRDGDTLTMAWEGAGTTTGTLEGDTFTMDNVGMILVYRRDPGGPVGTWT